MDNNCSATTELVLVISYILRARHEGVNQSLYGYEAHLALQSFTVVISQYAKGSIG